uniref:Uncharacterized protein n=1 Tax=Glossina austeni TaxID=7395 RepID=A0A1A9VES8_GLOAU
MLSIFHYVEQICCNICETESTSDGRKGRNCSHEAMGLSAKIGSSSSSSSYLFVSGRQVSATQFMTHIGALKIISKTQLHPLKLITFTVYINISVNVGKQAED